MSGKKSKVIQFPTATRKRIVCQYSSGTTTEPSHNRKVNSNIELKLLGAVIGGSLMYGLFILAGMSIYG